MENPDSFTGDLDAARRRLRDNAPAAQPMMFSERMREELALERDAG